ncbi:MAG: hypothetical protein H7263_13340 [Candidatus Sericytochromatia bacterium]|nr:hypothetical protein [Candidatus Sericytochromatia bacterium]
MQPYTQSLHPDEMFSQETKQLFLQIPHKVEIVHPKIELIDFNVPENGKYPLLRHTKMARISEPLTREDESDFEVRKHFNGSQYGYDKDTETGLFITSNHGSSIENFLKELYKHDQTSGQALLNSYHKFATTCSDVTSVEEKFIRQHNQLTQYLVKENIDVTEYDIDYVSYSQKTEDEQMEAVDKLYKKYGEGFCFPAYNDLDYTPFISNGDFYMYDSSGSRLYIVKNEADSQKIYMIKVNTCEMDDGMNEFIYDHKQSYLLSAKKIKPSNLIAEIQDGKLIKASLEFTNLDLMHSCIVETLYEEGKIKNVLPKLTFEELLDNYTLQKEFHHLKERAFMKIFKELELAGDTLTYEGFSVVKESPDFKIKHEDFSIHIAKDLKKRLEQKENLKIKELPQEYKDQINDYLNHLTQTYDNETTHLIAQYVRDEMAGTAKKLKR